MYQFIFACLLTMALLLCSTHFAGAQSYLCREPTPPYCVQDHGTFESSYHFKLCRERVESYVETVDDYVACLVREVEREISAAQDNAEDTVDVFNCRARGRSYCP